ncbi:MAG: hypothetical protein JWQ96_2949 [Segetibacter sp.]|jgi:hypothetical protein|nr:hypothetical protein [Segetibacter sp.]
MQNLILLHRTTNMAEATIVKGLLEENNVPVFLMNKQDSSYLNFGDIELYVPSHLHEVAKQLLQQGLSN